MREFRGRPVVMELGMLFCPVAEVGCRGPAGCTFFVEQAPDYHYEDMKPNSYDGVEMVPKEGAKPFRFWGTCSLMHLDHYEDKEEALVWGVEVKREGA